MNPTIPTPRIAADVRATGPYVTAYLGALDEMRRWARTKERRQEALKLYYFKQGKDDITAQVLIDRDQEVREAQLLLERATARAAALGPAALMEAQGLLLR